MALLVASLVAGSWSMSLSLLEVAAELLVTPSRRGDHLGTAMSLEQPDTGRSSLLRTSRPSHVLSTTGEPCFSLLPSDDR